MFDASITRTESNSKSAPVYSEFVQLQ